MKRFFPLLFITLLLLPVCALAQDLVVTGGDDYFWNNDETILTITGDGLTVQNKAGVNQTTDRLVIDAGVSSVTIAGVNIQTSADADGPAMLVEGQTTVTLSGTNQLISTTRGFAGLQQDDASKLLTITGTGSLKATGGSRAAGIGGAEDHEANLRISGGQITAIGGEFAAGIGSAERCQATVRIDGGTIVLAEGCNGAGIGGGHNGNATVTITGNAKIVKAISLANRQTGVGAAGGGAGIGGGNIGSATVEISGNAHIVSAVGSGNTIDEFAHVGSAGIGSGWEATVTIKDNALIEEAIGGYYAAGIGSARGKKAVITISDNAEIRKAVGGYKSAGIGGSHHPEGLNNNVWGQVTITGGLIKLAQGGEGAAGIGGACDQRGFVSISSATVNLARGGEGGPGVGSGANAVAGGWVYLAKDPGQVCQDAVSWIDIEGSPFTAATDITSTTAQYRCFRTDGTSGAPGEVLPPPVSTENPPRTGDGARLEMWIVLLFLSAAMIPVLNRRKA